MRIDLTKLDPQVEIAIQRKPIWESIIHNGSNN